MVSPYANAGPNPSPTALRTGAGSASCWHGTVATRPDPLRLPPATPGWVIWPWFMVWWQGPGGAGVGVVEPYGLPVTTRVTPAWSGSAALNSASSPRSRHG